MRALWRFFGHCLEWLAILLFWLIVAPLFIIVVLNYLGIIGIVCLIIGIVALFIHGIDNILRKVFKHREKEEENPDDWFV